MSTKSELAAAKAEIERLKRAAEAEAKSYGALISRLCASMGTWTGSWEDAARSRLAEWPRLKERETERNRVED